MIANDDFVPFGSFLYRKLMHWLLYESNIVVLTQPVGCSDPHQSPGYPSGCSISYWVSIDDLKI